MSLKNYLLGSAAIFSAFTAIGPAHAQSSASLNSQIKALQEQVRALNQQLQNLQSQVVQTQRNQAVTSETVTQLKAAPAPAAAASGVVVSMPNNRPTISTADGRNTISLTGRVHWDVGDYLNVSPKNAHVGPNNLNSGENFRRARLGVVGKVLGDWNYSLIYDFGGTNDSGPGGGGITSGGIETAELSYTGFRPFVVEGGAQDIPYTLDEATSSNDIMFIERASPQVIATNIAANDFRYNFGGHWNNDQFWVGAYLTGPQTGTSHAGIAQQVGAIQRATYQVLNNDDYSLHIGADAEELIKPPTTSGVRTLASLSDRPELRIDTTSIIGTGAFGSAANPVTGAHVLGAELAGGFGPLYAQAEYFHYNVERSGLRDANFDGGYLEASYTVTGEHRKYNPSTGAYTAISPAHPFDIAHLADGAWGAFELGARYSIIDLNDNYHGGLASAGGSSTSIAGGKQQVFTIGANWYVNNNIRFMLDYLHGKIDKPEGTAGVAGAPLGSNIGLSFDAIALRTQVAW